MRIPKRGDGTAELVANIRDFKRALRSRPVRALSWRNVLRRIRRSELRLERAELGYRDLGGEG